MKSKHIFKQPLLYIIGSLIIGALALGFLFTSPDSQEQSAETTQRPVTPAETENKVAGEQSNQASETEQIADDEPAQQAEDEARIEGLPANWADLNTAEKIAANPYNCDLKTQTIRSDNGQCLDQTTEPSTPQVLNRRLSEIRTGSETISYTDQLGATVKLQDIRLICTNLTDIIGTAEGVTFEALFDKFRAAMRIHYALSPGSLGEVADTLNNLGGDHGRANLFLSLYWLYFQEDDQPVEATNLELKLDQYKTYLTSFRRCEAKFTWLVDGLEALKYNVCATHILEKTSSQGRSVNHLASDPLFPQGSIKAYGENNQSYQVVFDPLMPPKGCPADLDESSLEKTIALGEVISTKWLFLTPHTEAISRLTLKFRPASADLQYRPLVYTINIDV